MLGMRIDWLTLTKNAWTPVPAKVDNRASALVWAHVAFEEIGGFEPALTVTSPARFYTWAWTDAITGARIDVPEYVDVQGVKVTFSGSAIQTPEHAVSMLRIALDHGWSVSRIDVALDLIEEGVTVVDFVQNWQMSRQSETVGSTLVQNRDASTLYIGSRKSDRFTRIYDKGREQNLAHNWVRVESEYKGRLARLVADVCRQGAIGALPDILYTLRFMPSSFVAKIEGLKGVGAAKLKTMPRVQSPRERWFYGQVFQALQNWVAEDYDAVRTWLNTCSRWLEQSVEGKDVYQEE